MRSSPRQTVRIISLLSALAIFATAPAEAQLSRLDRATLIDGLGREGMSELLLHLMKVDPPDDPVLAARTRIAQYRIRYGDTNRPIDQRTAAFDAALDTLRRTIRQHNEHEQRPMWQTDLGELLLFESLQAINQHASAFYEFGVPTREQNDTVERVVVEALEELSDADYRFSRLQLELARQPDHKTMRIDTGLWDRMIGQYYQLRTQYFLAHAEYYAALLGTDHPYYNNPQANARNRKMRGRDQDPEAERLRLLRLCVQRTTELTRDETDPHHIRRSCLSLAGRALTLLDDRKAAFAFLDPATARDEGDLTDLLARLGKSRLLHRDHQPAEAFQLLDTLASHRQVKGDLALRLLVTDHRFRLISASARSLLPERKRPALVAAYDVYMSLLADPNLNTVQSEGLKFHIYDRWAKSPEAKKNLDLLPPAVVMSIGEMARIEGQNLMSDVRATDESNEQRSQELRERAGAILKRSAKVLRKLLERSNLTTPVRARVMYNLGLAILLSDQANVARVLEAARLWVTLAEQMPGQADAERAITRAARQLRLLHGEPETSVAVQEDYEKVIKVLFAQFPDTSAMRNEVFYYATAVLMPAGKMAAASNYLAAIPPDHPDHFSARVQRLYAQVAIYRQDMPEEAVNRAAMIRDSIGRLAEDVQINLKTASGQDISVLRIAAGHCPLILADLALAEGKPAEAAEVLQSFADDHSNEIHLVRQALGKRIVALSGAGHFDVAIAEADRMMRRFPDEASWVIDKTLTDLDEQVDQLRKRAATEDKKRLKKLLEQQARNNAQAASKLARLLLDWASTQNFDDDQMLPYRLIYIRSLRLAGQAKQALERLRDIERHYRDDASVIHEAGETFFTIDGRENWIRSAAYFNRIIMDYSHPPFPYTWWNAWMRRFQIMEKMAESLNNDLPERARRQREILQDIPLRVMRLRKIDPNLGGQPYRTELERLVKRAGSI